MNNKSRMAFNEWRRFTESIVAGIFGGFVILGWSLAYELVKEKPIIWRIITPTLFSVIVFIVMIIILRFSLVQKSKNG